MLSENHVSESSEAPQDGIANSGELGQQPIGELIKSIEDDIAKLQEAGADEEVIKKLQEQLDAVKEKEIGTARINRGVDMKEEIFERKRKAKKAA